MNFPWKKSRTNDIKTANQLRVEIGLAPVEDIKAEEVKTVDNTQKVEEIFEALLEHEFNTVSPLDGSPVATIRSTDIYRVLCSYFDVDPKETEWSDYA